MAAKSQQKRRVTVEETAKVLKVSPEAVMRDLEIREEVADARARSRPFPKRPGLTPISRNGGWGPRWRGDGKEIFFLSPDGTVMSAAIDTAKGIVAGIPKSLFPTRLRPSARAWAVAKDGQRFLIPQVGPGTPITVVLNWPALLK